MGMRVAMADKQPMKVIVGNKDVIECLEQALVEARAGTLVGVVVCGITAGDGLITGNQGWQAAVRDDVLFPWPRLLATVTAAYQDLLQGIDDWK